MKDTVGNFVSFIEKAVILIILVSTITAIVFEILKMIDAKYVELADLLLLFIYVERIKERGEEQLKLNVYSNLLTLFYFVQKIPKE